jgi:cytochrome b
VNASKILVWDVPTRAFHWLLALSFLGAYLTSDSERLRDVHVLLGYTMLGLVGFRLAWGLVGSRYARFRSFAHGPRSVLYYVRSLVRGAPEHHLGHNPLGSWGILALLTLTVLAGATGYATYALDLSAMEEVHEALANTLLAVVFVHIGGVLVSSVLHRENLVRSMLTGYKKGEPSQGIRRSHWAVAVLLLAAVSVAWLPSVERPGALGGPPAWSVQRGDGHSAASGRRAAATRRNHRDD